MPLADTFLTGKNLKKSYQVDVVKDVSITIQSGEVVGLLGPNGAGKTTTFYMLVGLTDCDQGSIHLDTTDITRYSITQRSHAGISYLPQEPSIFRKLTVKENILAILELQKDLSKSEQQAQCQRILDEFNLTHIADTLGISVSGGERRRVEIARTIATKPKFILLDEPFAGIDPIAIIDLKKIIVQLSEQGIGILITDHNVRDTLTICQRAYIVSKGHIIADGPPQDIVRDDQVRSVYLGNDFQLHQPPT